MTKRREEEEAVCNWWHSNSGILCAWQGTCGNTALPPPHDIHTEFQWGVSLSWLFCLPVVLCCPDRGPHPKIDDDSRIINLGSSEWQAMHVVLFRHPLTAQLSFFFSTVHLHVVDAHLQVLGQRICIDNSFTLPDFTSSLGYLTRYPQFFSPILTISSADILEMQSSAKQGLRQLQ